MPVETVGRLPLNLEPVGPAIWLVDGDVVDFHGFPNPTRSVVVRLPAGELWVWSPVGLEPALKQAIDALGQVAHLVSPNKLHHLYLQAWRDAYPRAKLWGPASTVRKRRDLEFQPPLTDQAPAAWAGEIDQVWFRGSPLMDEIVFFHGPSKTAIIADLSQNFAPEFLGRHWRPWQRRLAAWWKITGDHGYAPLEWRPSWLDRRPARRALGRLLSWQPSRVIMAHGVWQKRDGCAYLRRAFAWLSP